MPAASVRLQIFCTEVGSMSGDPIFFSVARTTPLVALMPNEVLRACVGSAPGLSSTEARRAAGRHLDDQPRSASGSGSRGHADSEVRGRPEPAARGASEGRPAFKRRAKSCGTSDVRSLRDSAERVLYLHQLSRRRERREAVRVSRLAHPVRSDYSTTPNFNAAP
jgi:hypothetical protein